MLHDPPACSYPGVFAPQSHCGTHWRPQYVNGGPEVSGRTRNPLPTYPATSLLRSLAVRGTSALTSGGLHFVCGTQHGALRVQTAWEVLEPLRNIVRHAMPDTRISLLDGTQRRSGPLSSLPRSKVHLGTPRSVRLA